MIVTTTADAVGTDRDVTANNGTWTSQRIIVADHAVGFSLHVTTVRAGSVNTFKYENHVEAVHIIDGTGTVTDTATDTVHLLGPGTTYLLDNHDEHILQAHSDLRTVCVFTPATIGTERHNADGAYPVTP